MGSKQPESAHRRSIAYVEFAKQLRQIDDNVSPEAIWSTLANRTRIIRLLTAAEAKRETFTLEQLDAAVAAGRARLGLTRKRFEVLRKTVEKLGE